MSIMEELAELECAIEGLAAHAPEAPEANDARVTLARLRKRFDLDAEPTPSEELDCPECGALPGQPCMATAGRTKGQPMKRHGVHGARFMERVGGELVWRRPVS